MKKGFIGIRVETQLKEEIKTQAKKTRHSMGQYLLYCYEKEQRNNESI